MKGYIYGCVSAATFGLIPLFSLPVMAKGVGSDSTLRESTASLKTRESYKRGKSRGKGNKSA